MSHWDDAGEGDDGDEQGVGECDDPWAGRVCFGDGWGWDEETEEETGPVVVDCLTADEDWWVSSLLLLLLFELVSW